MPGLSGHLFLKLTQPGDKLADCSEKCAVCQKQPNSIKHFFPGWLRYWLTKREPTPCASGQSSGQLLQRTPMVALTRLAMVAG
jgi:hypothetical protein